MRIEVNGKPQDLNDGITVRDLLDQRGINPNVVACELNLTILKRAKLPETRLQEGDKLEIIQMIGGG